MCLPYRAPITHWSGLMAPVTSCPNVTVCGVHGWVNGSAPDRPPSTPGVKTVSCATAKGVAIAAEARAPRRPTPGDVGGVGGGGRGGRGGVWGRAPPPPRGGAAPPRRPAPD